MSLDLFAVQETIADYVRDQFPTYVVEEDGIPDDKQLKRKNGKVVNYIVLTWGTLSRKAGGSSMAGARWDDYESTVDVNVVSGVGRNARQSLNIVTDRLIGYRPTGGNELTTRGNSTTMTVRDVDGNITAYISSQRLLFGVNGENVGERIPVPTP